MTQPQKQDKRERVSQKIIHPDFRANEGEKLARVQDEQRVIGAVFLNTDIYPALAELLQPGDFFLLSHGYIWHAFDQLAARAEPIDLPNVESALGANLSSPALQACLEQAGDPAHAEYYAQRVRDAAMVIRVANAGVKIANLAFNAGEMERDAFIDECNRLVFEATEQRGEPEADLRHTLNAYMDKVEQVVNGGDNPLVYTGFHGLQDLIGGFPPEEVCVLAGNEGMGKTSFMLALIRQLCMRNIPIVLFTLEMTAEEIVRIFLAMETGISKTVLKSGSVNQSEWGRIVTASERIHHWPLCIVDQFPELTPTQLRRKLRKLSMTTAFKLVVIDGLWLMSADEKSKDGRFEDVRNIMKALKIIANKRTGFGVPILISHQYNSDMKSRRDKRPGLYDLAESAAVRRNAQIVLGMYREAFFEPDSDTPDLTAVYILKDRNGTAQGQSFNLRYDRMRACYEDA